MNTKIISIIILFTLLLILILIYFLCYPVYIDIKEIYENYSNHFKKNFSQIDTSKYNIKYNKIYISIASYRDPEIIRTVENIITNAKYPENLTIYILEQNDPKDKSSKNIDYNILSKSNVITHSVHYNEAKGPTWARYIIQQQWSGEEYFLQIDSHTLFIPNWDIILIDMLKKLHKSNNNTKIVLTQYPPEYDITNGKYDINILRGSLYIEGFQSKDNFTRIQSEYYTKIPPKEPFESEAWGACFSFSTWEIIKDAPYDPYLPYLFFGEELDITIRLYTHGWKFYSPNKSIVFTNFKRDHRQTIWLDHNKLKRNNYELLSRLRIYYRLNMYPQLNKYIYGNNIYNIKDTILLNNINKYKIGNTKSITDYENYAGIDLKNQYIKGNNRNRVIKINRESQYKLNNIMFWEPWFLL